MYLYDHCAYDCTGKELDNKYNRCTYEKECDYQGNVFHNTCMYNLVQADTEKGYENVAWCWRHIKRS